MGGKLTFTCLACTRGCFAAAASVHRGWVGWGGKLTFTCLACTRGCFAAATSVLRGWVGWGGKLTFTCLACTRGCFAAVTSVVRGWVGAKFQILDLGVAASSKSGKPPPEIAPRIRATGAWQCALPTQKNQAFENFFFEKGRRRQGEPIQDFIKRRENEYERLQSLSQGHTTLSTDLQAFFLLRNSGATMQQQKAILGQAGNEFDWDKVVEALMIQMNSDHSGSWQKGARKGYGAPLQGLGLCRGRRGLRTSLVAKASW